MVQNLYLKLTSMVLALMLAMTNHIYGDSNVTANPVNAPAEDTTARVVQFNIRCTGTGKTSVAYRAPRLVAQLKELRADSMGFQEATLSWMLYLTEHLDEYAYVGGGRGNGANLGEFSPIFYLKDKYNLIDSGTFWLSKTPNKPGSKYWFSNNIRICTWALLENKETGERYAHLNTHLDHISSKARVSQIKVLLTKVNELIGEYPIVLTGDFNDDCDSEMYKEATAVLKDSRLEAPVTDSKDTFHNYGGAVIMGLIDYVFVSDNVTPLVYHVIDDKIDGEYLSDHYGIYVDLNF